MMLIAMTALLALATALMLLKPLGAKAHCDTLDGPTARDGREALESGNLNHALKWVNPEDEAELRQVFDLARKARAQGGAAREVAERWFLENLVRLHRATEGEAYTGLKPHGVPMDQKVAAADKSIALGSLEPMKGLFTGEEMEHLRHKFHTAMSLKDYDPDDVPAARKYIAAYVDFFKLAEGEHHAQGHGAHAKHH